MEQLSPQVHDFVCTAGMMLFFAAVAAVMLWLLSDDDHTKDRTTSPETGGSIYQGLSGNAAHGRGVQMLSLTRKKGESIRIGDAVVTVVKSTGGRVELSIDAPADVRIMRTELLKPDRPQRMASDVPSDRWLSNVAKTFQ